MWSCTQLIALTTFVVLTSASTKRGYILTAPQRLLANSLESICISLHGTTGPAHVKLELLDKSAENVLSSTKHTMQKDTECLELFIPHIEELEAQLRFQASFDQTLDYLINNTKAVTIQLNPRITIIQTDKAVYKPGQLVRFRIMIVNHELKPLTDPISKVWLETPTQVRLAQWLEVKTLKGLAHLEFQLSQEPILGSWLINVEHQNASVERQGFSVSEYVLPRYEVTIKPPDYIRADAEQLTWAICAKYSYGLPVKGKVSIKAKANKYSWMPSCADVHDQDLQADLHYSRRCHEPQPDINVMAQLDDCYKFNVTGQQLGMLNEDKYHITPSSITVSATVSEANTDIERNASETTVITHNALSLQFIPHSPQYFKHGLPYQGKVQALLPNSLPAPNEAIQICLEVSKTDAYWQRFSIGCHNFTSDINGFVHFTIPPHQNSSVTSYLLTAKATNHETKYYSPERRWSASMYQPVISHSVSPWYSPSKSYIQVLDEATEKPRCNYHHTFRMQFVKPANDSLPMFHYLVTARGDLIASGQVHPLPIRSDVQHDDIIGKELLNGTDDTLESAYDRVNQFGLKILIIPKMSPESQLLVYYVRDNGETVATSFPIKIDQCYANKVSASWQQERLAPGSPSVLHLAAAPSSLCSISAVDKSTQFLGGSSSGPSVFDKLAGFSNGIHTLPYHYEPPNYCEDQKQERKKRSFYRPFFHQGSDMDASHAFDEFGVLVMTDLTIKTKPCVPNPWRVLSSDAFDGQQILERGDVGPMPRLAFKSPTLITAPPPMPVSAAAAPGMAGPSGGYAGAGMSFSSYAPAAVERRTFFPETWLWELVSTGKSGRAQVRSDVPHTITDWVGSAVCLSSHQGLGISEPMHLTAFQSFFVELALPYSIKRGEVVHIKVALFNFLPHSLPVQLTFEPSPGVELLTEESTVSECVAEQANWVHRFRVRATELGELNLTISAQVDSEYPKECGPEEILHMRDVLVKPVLVKPEGFPVEITKSSFVCPSSDLSSEDKNLVWNLELPSDLVDGSARAQVNVAADLMGPAMENLDKLVQMPMGCGEQNMVLFVPNLQVVNYLASTHQYNPVLRASAIKNMEKGYQRELNYRHLDGSYSAFGKSDSEGSMWLTAFVVKTFAQVKSHIFVDEADLKISLDWIASRQLENGCFPVVGKVLHKGMKGGLSEDRNGTTSALTAYILISLLETGLKLPSTLTSEAVHCVNADPRPDMYTLALTSYALSLLNDSTAAQQALDRLMAVANVQQDLLSWEKPGSSNAALNVEMTAYAILTLVKLGGTDNLVTAHKAVRWISQHRNAQGGFVSTQDTVVALEAMSKYAASLPAGNTLLNVLVSSTDMEHHFRIEPHDRLVQQRKMLPTLPTQVDIAVDGEGCVLVQSWLRYNIHTAKGDDALEVTLKVKPFSSAGKCTLETQIIEACARYKPDNQSSNMAVMEVSMPSGFIPEKESLQALDNNNDIKRWDIEKDEVNFYFDSLTNNWICFKFAIQQENEVENPVPANVHLYDYYQPEVTISKNYQLATECKVEEPLPSPIPFALNLPIMAKRTQNIDMPLPVGASQNVMPMAMEKGSMMQPIIMEPVTEVMSVEETDASSLNSDFVNVDHELEMPDGNEEVPPVYVDAPTTQPTVQSGAEVNEMCPRCWARYPANFSKIYCNSSATYKAVWRKPGLFRLLLDVTPSKSPSSSKRLVKIEIPDSCNCPALMDESEDSNVLIILAEMPSSTPTLTVNSSTNIWKIPAKQGQPQIIKTARKKC